tara:strand:- start:913 stop:1218 length:306 start_codon:yes stop_codon:yes gene_type:complete
MNRYCCFCNKLLPYIDVGNVFKECKNHPVIVQFLFFSQANNSTSVTLLENDDYVLILRCNLTELFSKKISTVIFSIPETIPVTPESLNSTIQKLFNLKAFL